MKNPPHSNDGFSVGLGLLDYINPIFYTVTSLTLMNAMKEAMPPFSYRMFVIGAVISLTGGYIIPTGKLIVGLGLIRFVMPVPLVFFVNSGILLSGLFLAKTVFSIPDILFAAMAVLICAGLVYILKKTGKFNTAAVLTGAAGYLLIYITLIALSLGRSMILPVILYITAIGLFVTLVITGIRADLYNPKVHWFIEICNVLCQGCVALGTLILFHAI